jgi:hypothetical protein
LSKCEIRNSKFKNEVIFKGFKPQKWEEKTKQKSPDFYIQVSVCNKKHRKMIKDLYFIFGL